MIGKTKKATRGSGNVFTDIGFGREEADNLLLRAQLMSRVRDAVREMTQKDAAALCGVSQPRLNDLLRGKIEKFSLDALVNMLARAGLRVELRVRSVKAPAGNTRPHRIRPFPKRGNAVVTNELVNKLREHDAY
jgi:predicted XRE-type DNA-binding protein